MTETHITLYGDDSEQFEEIREELSEHRAGDLSNAETNRRLMEHYKRTTA